ncbi:hypothetical protein YC2023_031026 [Brassica napus]
MVERSLRMREARGSIPRISNFLLDTRCVNLKLESSSPVKHTAIKSPETFTDLGLHLAGE